MKHNVDYRTRILPGNIAGPAVVIPATNRPTPPGGVAHSSGTNWTGRSGWVIIGIGLRRDNNSSIAWFFRCASIELLGGIGQPAGFCGVPRGAELSGRSFAM
jgi:hypothetical protein